MTVTKVVEATHAVPLLAATAAAEAVLTATLATLEAALAVPEEAAAPPRAEAACLVPSTATAVKLEKP